MPPTRDLFDLRGRSAIVTGGSRGLGLEMAEGLAEAGASLMLCARREEWLTPAVAEPGIKERSPLGRVGAPGELKGVAVFLAADASNYITGRTIIVDGGGTVS